MREATAMARRAGEPETVALTEWAFAELLLAWGDTEAARSLLEDARALRERSGFASGVGWCHNSLGWTAVADNDFARARSHFERAAEMIPTDDGGEWLAPHALAALGPLTVLAGDPELGVSLAEMALASARRLGIRAVLIMALTSGAETAILAGVLDRARELLEDLVQILLDDASLRWAADALELAGLLLEQQEPRVAAEALASAAALRGPSGPPGGIRPIGVEVRRAHERLGTPFTADNPPSQARDAPAGSTKAVLSDVLRNLKATEARRADS